MLICIEHPSSCRVHAVYSPKPAGQRGAARILLHGAAGRRPARGGRCGNALFLHEDLLAQASASKTLEHYCRRRAAQSDADVGYGLLAVRRLQSGAMIEDPETHEEPLAMVGSWFISADSEQVLGMRFVEYCVMLRKRHDVTIRPLPLSTMRSGIGCSRPCMECGHAQGRVPAAALVCSRCLRFRGHRIDRNLSFSCAAAHLMCCFCISRHAVAAVPGGGGISR